MIAGDLHLKSQIWNSRPDIRDDAYDAFMQIVRYCVAKVRSLVLLGDIFNSPRPNSMDVAIFRTGVDMLHAADLPVYVIQGQHDWSDPPWPVALASTGVNVEHVDRKVFEPVDGLKFFGVDRRLPGDDMKQILLSVPADVTVLAMHQLFREAFNMEGQWDCQLSWLPSQVNTVFAADYHDAVSFKGDACVLNYTGSTQLCEISESRNKSFIELLKTASGYDVNRIPIESRPVYDVCVNNSQQLEDAVRMLSSISAGPVNFNNKVSKPLVVVSYLASVPEVVSRLQAVLADKALLWPRPTTVRTIVSSDETIPTADKNPEINELLGKLLDRQSVLFEFVTDLLKQGPFTLDNKWRMKMGML